jgi:hypothetical protein
VGHIYYESSRTSLTQIKTQGIFMVLTALCLAIHVVFLPLIIFCTCDFLKEKKKSEPSTTGGTATASISQSQPRPATTTLVENPQQRQQQEEIEMREISSPQQNEPRTIEKEPEGGSKVRITITGPSPSPSGDLERLDSIPSVSSLVDSFPHIRHHSRRKKAMEKSHATQIETDVEVYV